ncbi:LptA/OstA family protein [Maricaulis sp.]|jgi:lipopolysaccharide export system protein LptA|uniref:LptA/OstA family protein n=1 Tax=Maricaulis sp. TaxID=1486257 RepID=UPI0025E02274|nr:LptA/OstA family protein [Maricaulis sp.]MDF1770202.1 LptA/OstA family protein [Maricaulis sp.]
MMRLIAIALLGLMSATLSTGNAAAQIGNSGLPLDIEADTFEVLDAERHIVWLGNVHVVQGDSSLQADRMDVYYTEAPAGGWGDIDRIVATDNVFYITPAQRARGDRGVYQMSEEVITLTGEVVITQGDNVITTNRFVNDLTTGNSNFGEAGTGERVRMVLQPARDANETETSEDAPEG